MASGCDSEELEADGASEGFFHGCCHSEGGTAKSPKSVSLGWQPQAAQSSESSLDGMNSQQPSRMSPPRLVTQGFESQMFDISLMNINI